MRLSRVRVSIAAAAALIGVIGIGLAARAHGDGGAAKSHGDAAKEHGPIAWTESLSDAEKTAAKSNKVVMVDFWAEWCGPCKQMLNTTYKDAKVVARAKQFVPVLVNVDNQKEIAKKYNIDAIPVALFMDGHGKVLVRSLGYQNAASFLKLMDQAQRKTK